MENYFDTKSFNSAYSRISKQSHEMSAISDNVQLESGESIGEVLSNFTIPFVSYVEGFKTCVKGLHWGSTNYNEHVLLDELYDILNSYEDKLVEVSMGLSNKRLTLAMMETMKCECNSVECLITTIEELVKVSSGKLEKLSCDISKAALRNVFDDFLSSLYVVFYKLRILVRNNTNENNKE